MISLDIRPEPRSSTIIFIATFFKLKCDHEMTFIVFHN